MWIFQHRELTVLFAISIALFVPYYLVFSSRKLKISSPRSVSVFFLIWLILFTAEYFIFGPDSFVATDTDSRNIAFQYYLANLHQGEQFSHEIAGGQDLGIIHPGTQYLALERLLLHIFDPWIVIWLHKLMIGALAFAGSYLLARGIAEGIDRGAAVAAAAVFPVSHFYLGNYSIEFGTGFAAVPLAVYAAVACVNKRNFLLWIAFAGAVLALAQPMKIFPAAFLATACALVLYDKRNIAKTAAAFAGYVALSVLNWHEVLYGLLVLVEQTTRGFGAAKDAPDLSATLIGFYGRLIQNWFVSVLCLVSVVLLWICRDRFALSAVAALILFSAGFVFADAFAWQTVGLAFVNRIEHAYMFLALPVLAVPVVARAVSVPRRIDHEPETRPPGRLAIAVLAGAFCLLTWNKFLNGAWFMALGGQSSAFGFAALERPAWKANRQSRVITLFDVPPPNITAAYYGIDSFDGTALLNPKPWNDYWASIKRIPLPTGRVATRPSVDWRHWNGRTYSVGDSLRLDLLRIANVGYLVSALPLTGEGLSPVRTIERVSWTKTRPGFFADYGTYLKHRLRRIFDPGDLYIYALDGALPRVFAATGVAAAPPDLDTARLHEKVAAEAPAGRVVVGADDAKALAGLGTLKVASFAKVADGYDIRVSAPEGGVLVVNNVHSRFWQARAGDKALDVVPANAVHMAVAVPAGADRIKLRYRRPNVFGGS